MRRIGGGNVIHLFTVAAPSRAGTTWFSRLFTTQHSFCYHELTTLLRPYPSNHAVLEWFQDQTATSGFEPAQRRWILHCYPTYFARLFEPANSGQYIVGNSDGGVLEFLPALWLLWPDMKFIFSVRNGINCVQSRQLNSADHPRFVVGKRERTWRTKDAFTQACHVWAQDIRLLEGSKQWLRTRQAQYIETTLEGVTGSLDEVRKLWDWVGIGRWKEYAERNQKMLSTPINARTNTQSIVGWQEIWNRWTAGQRETYWSICGETHRRLGYADPFRGVAAHSSAGVRAASEGTA